MLYCQKQPLNVRPTISHLVQEGNLLMSFDTKERIAITVLSMIRQQPIGKITVQQIMARTNMKRQSFYYHFKDIYDVLDWSVRRYFCVPFSYRPEQSFDAWCEQTLTYLSDNQSYARKVALALGEERVRNLFSPVIQPQVDRLLFHTVEPVLDEDQRIAREIVTRVIMQSFYQLVTDHTKLRVDVQMRNAHALLKVLAP